MPVPSQPALAGKVKVIGMAGVRAADMVGAIVGLGIAVAGSDVRKEIGLSVGRATPAVRVSSYDSSTAADEV
jgi:hypothetical protein